MRSGNAREESSRAPFRVRTVSLRELTGRSKTRNGDMRPPVPLILRSGVLSTAEAGSGDGTIVANSGQLGGLFEASGYLLLSNGQREFASKPLAVELQFTAPETTPLGIVFWAPALAGARIVNAV